MQYGALRPRLCGPGRSPFLDSGVRNIAGALKVASAISNARVSRISSKGASDGSRAHVYQYILHVIATSDAQVLTVWTSV